MVIENIFYITIVYSVFYTISYRLFIKEKKTYSWKQFMYQSEWLHLSGKEKALNIILIEFVLKTI